MRNKVGKLSPNTTNAKRASADSLTGSLYRYGYTRFPGSTVTKFPYKEKNNVFRTGLDLNAEYIKRMDKASAEREKAIVKELLELAEEYYPEYDVGNPRSPFWTNMSMFMGHDRGDVAKIAKLTDGDNYFELSDPERLIQYAYLRVHPDHAPSSRALKEPRYSRCSYYVNDEDIETKERAVKISLQNKMRRAINGKSLADKKVICRLLGNAVLDNTTEERVTVILEDYIGKIEDENTFEYRNLENVLSLNAHQMSVRDVVRQALLHTVVRKNKAGEIYKGENRVADSEKDYVEFLTLTANEGDLKLLEKELTNKKLVK